MSWDAAVFSEATNSNRYSESYERALRDFSNNWLCAPIMRDHIDHTRLDTDA